jgi:hypothetical protein
MRMNDQNSFGENVTPAELGEKWKAMKEDGAPSESGAGLGKGRRVHAFSKCVINQAFDEW